MSIKKRERDAIIIKKSSRAEIYKKSSTNNDKESVA